MRILSRGWTESSIRLWCSDNLGNLFIFYALSTNRNNLLKIIKETNEQEYEYDLSLSKKISLIKKPWMYHKN